MQRAQRLIDCYERHPELESLTLQDASSDAVDDNPLDEQA
jgi:hypothetical protein